MQVPRKRVGQSGGTMIVCLLMMLAVLMLGTSAAQIAIQEEKASRNERGRLIAQLAAEATLKDAELDIENSSRVEQFVQQKATSVSGACEAGLDNPFLGLCYPAASDMFPVWQKIDLEQGDRLTSVPYGFFTERSLNIGGHEAPARSPKYIIEVLANTEGVGMAEESSNRLYRITAIGYGKKESSQVVLQAYYRKARSGIGTLQTGRLGWREIMNWEELRDALMQE